jgi:hypothetical protein
MCKNMSLTASFSFSISMATMWRPAPPQSTPTVAAQVKLEAQRL